MAKTEKIANPTPSSPPWATGAVLQPGAVAPVATPPSPAESGSVADVAAPGPVDTSVAVDNPPNAPETVFGGTTPQAPVETAIGAAPAIAPVVEVASELVDTVTVTVPRAYQLRIDNFKLLQIPAGVQEMERAYADHWYSVASGVRIYQK